MAAPKPKPHPARDETIMENLKTVLIRDRRYQQGLAKCLEKPQVLVAPTNYCNFSCSYCSTKNITNTPVNMDVELATRIVDQAVENGWGLSFGQTYEPFLHPRIEKIALYALDKGRVFTSATNGMAIKRNMYDVPMNLLVSYSADEADYRHRGSRIPFAVYREKLRAFFRHRIDKAVPGTISIQIADYGIFAGDMSYDKNVSDIDGISSKYAALVASLDCGPPLDPEACGSRIAKREPLPVFREGKAVLQVQPTKIMPNSYDAFLELDEPAERIGYCDSCFTMMSIQADGKVAFCCCDPTAKAVAGTISPDTDLKAFWLGEEMTRVRESFARFRPLHAFCAKCLANVSEHIKPLLTVNDPRLVAAILRDHGVDGDLPWFQFPKGA